MALSVEFFLLMAFLCSCSANAENKISYVVDAAAIAKSSSDIVVDGKVSVELDGNRKTKEYIYYSFSRIGPVVACGDSDCNPDSLPKLAWGVTYGNHHVDSHYLCSKIGVSSAMTDGMYDLYCDGKTRLQWNGKEYEGKKAK